ncbi:Ger(x)C family spore germination protein [Cohnella sp.]|uniref:Ger(x)C family spore germination protein n=1 Tax=Cohnella sp. TaxID=1883426 RepID=UPI003561AE6E
MKVSYPRTTYRIALLCLPLFLLSGCWDRTEVNDLALIMAAGIDKKSESSIELSVQIFIPKASGGGGGVGGGMGNGGGGGGEQTLVRSQEGVTIADAMAKLQAKIPRKIFWGHGEVFIIGEKLARDGIREHADFLMRNPETRERADLFVCRGQAKAALELIPPLERSSAEVLREMAITQIGIKTTVKDLAQMLSGDSGAAAVPWVEILPPKSKKKEKQTIPYITGTALFKEDKMVGKMDAQTTKGLLWVRDEVKLATVTVRPEEAEGFVSARMLRSKTGFIPKIGEDGWKLTVKIETTNEIVQNTTRLSMLNPEHVKEIEKEAEEEIEHYVRIALLRGQKKLHTDVFGFADAFRRKYPKQWNKEKGRWDEIFPEIEVEVEAKVRIIRPGMSSEGAVRPEDEVRKK